MLDHRAASTPRAPGGVTDHSVTQVLRQREAAMFKRYSQAKLNMMREAPARLDRQANFGNSFNHLPATMETGGNGKSARIKGMGG